jgi:predicted dithiol-disulfide oxidoreductase (DUF899 family)
VTAGNRETAAISVFLEKLRDARAARKRLFARVREEPEVVLAYLDSLPEGVEEQHELYQKLRAIAKAAHEGRLDLTE